MSTSDATDQRGLIRQGDVLLVPIAEVPEGGSRVSNNGTVILAEGEATGHAHRIVSPAAELKTHGRRRYLTVTGDHPVTIEHEEHDPLLLPPGAWEVRRQREFDPATGQRRVAD